jgi:ribosomal protein S18 acetylase RimI-like enzyme
VPAVDVRPLGDADLAAAEVLLDGLLAGRVQARLGESHDVLALPGLGVRDGDQLVGLATWSGTATAGRAELAALAVSRRHQGRGVGAALVEAVADAARVAGADTLWLVTTNDNLDALRLYQRHGFRLAALRPGSVDASRDAGAVIPREGRYGIPLHDELVLERPLRAG